jgi:hypothetical protein
MICIALLSVKLAVASKIGVAYVSHAEGLRSLELGIIMLPTLNTLAITLSTR